MRIVFMGTPNFAVPILEALNTNYEIVGVVSQPSRAKKRGVIIDTPVAEYAKNNTLLLFQPEKISTIILSFLLYKFYLLYKKHKIHL